MRITGINTGCKRNIPMNGEAAHDYILYFFRSPAAFGTGQNEAVMKNGSAVIFMSGQKQFFRGPGGNQLKYDMVSFRPSSADKQYISALDIQLNVPVEIQKNSVISSIIRTMKLRSGSTGKRTGEFLELSMRLVFITLSEAFQKPDQSVASDIPHYTQLKQLREDIYDDPMGDWSVDKICYDLRMSKTYFHRLYLRAFGITCRQDVISSRLSFAERLLSDTELSVSEIAERCGYESDSYFMRQFRQNRSCTPTEYRREVTRIRAERILGKNK